MSDLNIDYLKIEESNTRKLKRIIQAARMKQIFIKETQVTYRSASLIDMIPMLMNH